MSKQRSTLLPKRQQYRTNFALKFRPFDKVERCFDIVASVDRALVLKAPARLMWGMARSAERRNAEQV